MLGIIQFHQTDIHQQDVGLILEVHRTNFCLPSNFSDVVKYIQGKGGGRHAPLLVHTCSIYFFKLPKRANIFNKNLRKLKIDQFQMMTIEKAIDNIASNLIRH